MYSGQILTLPQDHIYIKIAFVFQVCDLIENVTTNKQIKSLPYNHKWILDQIEFPVHNLVYEVLKILLLKQ